MIVTQDAINKMKLPEIKNERELILALPIMILDIERNFKKYAGKDKKEVLIRVVEAILNTCKVEEKEKKALLDLTDILIETYVFMGNNKTMLKKVLCCFK